MLSNHPLRKCIVQEMLLRRFPAIVAPLEIIQIVRIVAPELRAREIEGVRAMPGGAVAEAVIERHASGTYADGIQMLWECHSEASTATLLLPAVVDAPDCLTWIEELPGEVIRATRISIVVADTDALAPIAVADMVEEDLVTCMIGDCRIWSDFRIGVEGYGRIVIAANGCPAGDLGRIVQRVQELGNYRNLALLGLPIAQEHGPRLDRLERELAERATAIADSRENDEALLDSLSALAADLARISAISAFRISATRAYAAIVADRLALLDARPIAGHQSLADFNDRRLIPAVRTCATFGERLETLSGRAARITALLRTRIETRIERQNRDLLTSVEQGIMLQLKLQHLVESLSVLAISYYAISLIGYVAKGASKEIPGLSAELITALAVVPVTVAIALFIARRRRFSINALA